MQTRTIKRREDVNLLYTLMRLEIGTSKLNYGQIADKAGIKRRWIDRFMQGTIPEPRFDVVCSVCYALNIKIRFGV